MATNHSISPPKNHFKPLRNTKSKHIIELDKNLEKEAILREELCKVTLQSEKSTQYTTRLFKNFVETNKKIEAEYSLYIQSQNKQFKRLRTFIIFAIGFGILSHFLFYYGITLLTASTIVYYSNKIELPNLKTIRNLKRELKVSRIFLKDNL